MQPTQTRAAENTNCLIMKKIITEICIGLVSGMLISGAILYWLGYSFHDTFAFLRTRNSSLPPPLEISPYRYVELLSTNYSYARYVFTTPTGFKGHGDWHPVTELPMLWSHVTHDREKNLGLKSDIQFAITTNSP